MTVCRHIAPHAREKIEEDIIFKVGGLAKDAMRRLGTDRVIDGSIGILLDDEGKVAFLPSVELAARELTLEETAIYAPIGGLPEFCEDVIDYLMNGLSTNQPTGSIATAGATGAIRLSVWNFLEENQSFITHDYYWAPYRSIAVDSHRNIRVFPTMREDGGFNVPGALTEVASCLERQGRALLLLNTPCHNPTGISIEPREATELRDGLRDIALAAPDKPVILLIDAAYWEFGDPEQNRHFLSLFQDLPENMVFCLAFTLSKSLTRYGLRTGALMVGAKDSSVVADIVNVCKASVRATWSNTNRLGQALFSRIHRDPALSAQLKREQRFFADLCNSRGRRFVEEATEIGLPHTPYHGGFFITLPTTSSREITDKLMQKNIYFVPMSRGIRLAFCALSSKVIPGLAQTVKEVFQA